jgi:predicted ATP-dependent serine protease
MLSSWDMKYNPKPRPSRQRRRSYTCQRCGYEWIPYGGKRPKRCARCRSPEWNTPVQKPQMVRKRREEEKPPDEGHRRGEGERP